MRDFSQNHSAIALNTATLGHNLDGAGAGWSPDQVIDAWQEALPMMKPGDRWKLYVHPDLGYGERGSGGAIGPNQAMIFEVELLSVQ